MGKGKRQEGGYKGEGQKEGEKEDREGGRKGEIIFAYHHHHLFENTGGHI